MAGPTNGSDARSPMPGSLAGEMPVMAFTQVQTRMMREALAMQAELIDFVRSRIGRDIETNEKLAKCRSMPEALEVMTGFCRQAIDTYADEARKLMAMGRKAADEAAEAAKAAV